MSLMWPTRVEGRVRGGGGGGAADQLELIYRNCTPKGVYGRCSFWLCPVVPRRPH